MAPLVNVYVSYAHTRHRIHKASTRTQQYITTGVAWWRASVLGSLDAYYTKCST